MRKRLAFVFTFSVAIAFGLVAPSAGQRPLTQVEARTALNSGLRLARSTDYLGAIDLFKQALARDPDLIEAELAMANANTSLLTLGGASPQGQQGRAAAAMAGYEKVLERVPDNVDAVAGLGRVYQTIGDLPKARTYYLRAARMASSTAAPFFAVSAVDWSLLTAGNSPIDRNELIDEAIENMERALAFEPTNRDAMVFLNLLLREKARVAPDAGEKARLLAKADEWFDRSLPSSPGRPGPVPALSGTLAPAPAVTLPALARPINPGRDPDAIRIGILHSLSGSMAISETSLKDAVMMAVDEINAKGGVLGHKLEPIVVDPASNWDLFRQKTEELLVRDQVSAVFGCWTSVSRKSVLSVFESRNGLLFYPVQYEGEEQSPNIFYTGSVPNQQLFPAAQFLMSTQGGLKKKFFLLGTDYVYPRTANRVLKNFLISQGIPAANIIEEYTPFGHSNYQEIVRRIREFGSAGDAAVLSTINGDSSVPFYMEFAKQGLRGSQVPIMAFSIGEDELRSMETQFMTGHLAAWNYFQSIDTTENKAFVAAFKAYSEKMHLMGAGRRVTDDPMVASYSGVYLWKAAVEKANSFEPSRVSVALNGMEIDSPGGRLKMHPENHHTIKSAYVGRIRADGQFDIVWKSEPIEPQAFSPFISGARR